MKTGLLWLLGYLGMWVSKLILTELFTDISAIQGAWNSVLYRFGAPGHRSGDETFYSPIKALERVWEVALPTEASVVCFFLFLGVMLGTVLWKWKLKKLNLLQARNASRILVIGVMSLLWICITAQPVVIHTGFQFRSIILLLWSVGAYLYLILEESEYSEKNRREIEK